MLLHIKISPAWTLALTYPITRRGIQSKHEQLPVAHSKVTFTRCPLKKTHWYHWHCPQGRAAVPRPLCISIPKYWLCTRVSRTLKHAHTHTHRHILIFRHRDNVMLPISPTHFWSSSGHLLRSPCLHLASCWPSDILAAIQSRAQKCFQQLWGIISRSRLLRR